MTKSNENVRRVDFDLAENEGLITLADAACAAGVTTLTANKRLISVGLVGPDVAPVAFAVTALVGRPARLFPRVQALEAVLNGVGNRRAQGEKDPAPAATEADELLAFAAEMDDAGCSVATLA